MKTRKKLFKSFIIILVSIILFVTGTLAWTSYSGLVDGGSVIAGNLEYNIYGELISNDTYLNPHRNLLSEDIIIDNQSSVNTQVRLKIEYTIKNGANYEQKIFRNEEADVIIVEFSTLFSFDPVDNYWYYIDKVSSLSAKSGSMDVISSIYYDGFKVGNDYINAPIEISILLQAKQTDHVTWEDLYNYDFSTGKPTT